MNTNYYAKLAKNKSLLKEYKTSDCDRTVYLEDGDEFQFQLFNPETTEICARIFIEDTQLSHDIVIRPGERIWIERYTNVNKKFKFENYIVSGDNAQVKKAISHNGLIKIDFFRKKLPTINKVYPSSITYVNLNDYKPETYDWKIYCNNINSVAADYRDDATITACDGEINYMNLNCLSGDTLSQATAKMNSSISAENSAFTCSDNTSLYYSSTPTSIQQNHAAGLKKSRTLTSSTPIANPSISTGVFNPDFYKDKNELETGRIGEGRYSNQKFDTVNMDFETWPFKTETIKILPLSRKPYNSNDLRKLYCSNCGRKLNTKYKYCPYCGAKVD